MVITKAGCKLTILTLLVLLNIGQVSAQIKEMTREEKLRQIANPSFVLDGKALTFEHSTILLDTISEDDNGVEAIYFFRNTTQEPILITQIQVSCDCVETFFSTEVIQPGEQSKFRAVYYPMGYPGSFNRYMTIYTSLSDREPTARVYLKGFAEASLNLSNRYPYQIGDLYLKQDGVVFQNSTQRQVERVLVYNASDSPLTVSAKLPDGFTLYTEPAIIPAGTEGDIVVSSEATISSMEESVIEVTLDGVKNGENIPFFIRFKH